jgi:cbb3-type cytochrome oxidase subunit 3
MTVETFSATGLLILWITFTAVALTGAVAVLVWATRTKQFSNQDEARYLPLKSGIPEPATRSAGKPVKGQEHRATEAPHAAS